MTGADLVAAELAAAREALARAEADPALCRAVASAADLAARAIAGGGTLLLCGNGGSAADCQHWAAELVGRYLRERPGLPALALTTDSSALTAIGNDYGYDRVFARQVEALGRPGDVLFALSTSGRSPNIKAALHAARARGLGTVAFTGADGTGLAALCDVLIAVPARETPRIQELHAVLGHAICGLIEAAAGGGATGRGHAVL
ncbi:MAG: D-sedoheptulose 7-phosphate isomerase [Acetobacteraceae bacterium]